MLTDKQIMEYVDDFELVEEYPNAVIWGFLSGLEAANVITNDRKHSLLESIVIRKMIRLGHKVGD